MPISKREFEKGKITKPIEVSILIFLKRNSDKAYTMGDIIKGMKFRTGEHIVYDFVTGVTVKSALESLEKDNKIRKKTIDTVEYYTV